ncbi:hypothetical protein N5079_32565 [Planotetraspora sp. A-T 1434]|uniref:hypothetical protein n=1 Tax=Planotetraspora sp. A-T 1434 TaxID=2979219 RepID=UPI0021BE18F0|nr:hypothetical protein [Planotetraspora sp. A-T 1434]MCT9934951.1 hypothetical protein [Planotetraspora sp. A-T 1434]
MTAIIELEHSRMRPGQVAEALHAWMAAAVPGSAHRIAANVCMCPECCGDGPRGRLEDAMRALPAWAKPYLYGLVLPIDRRFVFRTFPDPLVSQDIPWWQRRRRRVVSHSVIEVGSPGALVVRLRAIEDAASGE